MPTKRNWLDRPAILRKGATEAVNIVICDDESVYIKSLDQLIRSWSVRHDAEHALTISSFRSGEELLEKHAEGYRIDVLFMDIQFPNEDSGLQVVREIRRREPALPVVFTTNYGEYVYEGYTVNAFRFLRKPLTQNSIDECMDILWHQYSLTQREAILFQTRSQTLCLPAGSILYLEAQGHTIRIRTTDATGVYTLRSRFSDIRKLLPTELFIQCHRSYDVNIQFVRRFTHSEILMSNGDLIPIGRTYVDGFVRLFHRYHQGGPAK